MEAVLQGISTIFMGTPDFAVPSLKALLDAGADIKAVITQPSKPRGRNQAVADSPVKEFALSRGLRILEPTRLRDEDFLLELAAIKPELIAVVAYGKILPKAVLELPGLGCVNVHGSLLPAYRGAAPINWAIINGEEKTGVTTMLMDEGMDTGDMLLTEELLIDSAETAGELFERLKLVGAELLVRTVSELKTGKLTPIKQDESLASYARILKKKDGEVDWTLSATEIERRIRGFNPWPGAFTYLNGKLVKLHTGSSLAGDSEQKPGAIVELSNDGIVVNCGKGLLRITELQIEGKRRMRAADFIKGYELTGECFG
jgi:methionyl-tRNA formyltransferase